MLSSLLVRLRIVSKYNKKEDGMHLLNCVCLLYDITTDFTGTLYIGFTLRWDYIRRIVYLSISGYRKDFVSILYSLAS